MLTKYKTTYGHANFYALIKMNKDLDKFNDDYETLLGNGKYFIRYSDLDECYHVDAEPYRVYIYEVSKWAPNYDVYKYISEKYNVNYAFMSIEPGNNIFEIHDNDNLLFSDVLFYIDYYEEDQDFIANTILNKYNRNDLYYFIKLCYELYDEDYIIREEAINRTNRPVYSKEEFIKLAKEVEEIIENDVEFRENSSYFFLEEFKRL